MTLGGHTLQKARADFQQARQRAAMEKVMGSLTGKPVELLSFGEVYEKLKAVGAAEAGLREIPLEAIVGSVGRSQDFSRTFLPRQDSDESRWANVKTAVKDLAIDSLPPIQVYQIGTAYFVQDGHHRVSIARQIGQSYIHAYVTEVRTRVPLAPDTPPDELIIKAEYAAFLDYTRLDDLRPGANLMVSAPGKYAHLEAHIEVQRFFAESAEEREIAWAEAVTNWYDQAYLPVVLAIREQGILRDFPDRTETDLYLWITEHQNAIRRELGWEVKPEVAAGNLPDPLRAASKGLVSRLGRRVLKLVLPQTRPSGPTVARWQHEKVVTRYSEALFAEILVPFGESVSGGRPLEQALLLAKREQSTIRGLLLLNDESEPGRQLAGTTPADFSRRCQEAGVTGFFAIGQGNPVEVVQARASLTDLVILSTYPRQEQSVLPLLCQATLRQCTRPLLLVPERPSLLERPLLLYDHSPRSREALFIAAYLAEEWRVPLTVLTLASRTTAKALAYAQDYLAMHEITAEWLHLPDRTADAILHTATEQASDLILAGNDRQGVMPKLTGNDRLVQLASTTTIPLLVCS
jgi:nucleotide-binding universal stress UspA family protein